MKNLDDIQSRLVNFHKNRADIILAAFSDIAGNQFEGEFNVSGFHDAILSLPNKAESLWGIDRCLRIQDIPDSVHSFLFHMGIFARSVDLDRNYVDPFKDARFHALQKETLLQFISLLDVLGIDLNKVETTYLEQTTLGGNTKGRDTLLKRKYDFPTDEVSRDFLKDKVRLIPVKSLANIDITPVEGSLVGFRLEVAYRGVEIGTVVFDCFKIESGTLAPINYVAGYAVGIERLIASLCDKHFLTSIPRFKNARKILADLSETARSSLFEKEAMTVIYGAEVLAHLPTTLSRHQKEKVRFLRGEIAESIATLGADKVALDKLILYFNSKVIA